MSRSSFTLIELLVVIAILAILSVTVVLVINPADLIRQSRDSSRMTDLANLKKALSLFDVTNPDDFTGTSSIVYVSIPDSSGTCVNLGLPELPTGWTYHCVTSSTLAKTDGTGWVPTNLDNIAYGSVISKLPLDPQNSTSSGLYYQYVTGGSFVVKAQLESDKYKDKAANDGGASQTALEMGTDLALAPNLFPDNWIKMPGNSSFGTSDFWVMKYEAKCASAANNSLLTTPATQYNTLWNSSTTAGSACTSANGKYVTSNADGYPIAYISHATAKTYCSGIGAHLLTNEEYMTIARNAEQVNGNWSTSVGSGYLYSGHNDGTPNAALTAANDTDYYFGTGNSSGNQRRVLTLSNGNAIWDLAGNVYEHVQRTAADITTAIDLPACSDGVAGWGWCQYGNTTAPYVSAYTADVAQANVGPSNTDWNSTQGMGQLYTYKNGTDQATTVFIRGGSWSYGSNAGAFALTLDWGTGSAYNRVGFRCAR